jgi:hypothetical protein
MQRGEELHPLRRSTPFAPCAIEGCDKPSWLRSERICTTHYYRQYRGYPLTADAKACENCGVEFTPNRVARAGPGVLFCSRKCKSETGKFRNKYGLTGMDVRRMLAAQDGHCAICPTPIVFGVSTCVDHCHATNVVRGVLCIRCNTGLGFFRDNPEYLASAISYLGR